MRLVAADVTGARDEAREWLTFCRALGLVAESDRGYHRDGNIDPDELGDRFRERVFGAKEVLTALEQHGMLTVDEIFDSVRTRVPEWERQRHDDFEQIWRERVARLLGWAALFGLVKQDGERYELT